MLQFGYFRLNIRPTLTRAASHHATHAREHLVRLLLLFGTQCSVELRKRRFNLLKRREPTIHCGNLRIKAIGRRLGFEHGLHCLPHALHVLQIALDRLCVSIPYALLSVSNAQLRLEEGDTPLREGRHLTVGRTSHHWTAAHHTRAVIPHHSGTIARPHHAGAVSTSVAHLGAGWRRDRQSRNRDSTGKPDSK